MNPSWWDSLSEIEKEEICDRALYMIRPDIPIRNDYLRIGLEGICKWKIESVQDED
jgi:hypothetical protein